MCTAWQMAVVSFGYTFAVFGCVVHFVEYGLSPPTTSERLTDRHVWFRHTGLKGILRMTLGLSPYAPCTHLQTQPEGSRWRHYLWTYHATIYLLQGQGPHVHLDLSLLVSRTRGRRG